MISMTTTQNKEERVLNIFLKTRYLRMARLGFLEMKAQNSSSETDLQKNSILIYLNQDNIPTLGLNKKHLSINFWDISATGYTVQQD